MSNLLLTLEVSIRAREDIERLALWLYGQDIEWGERFRETVKIELPALCQMISEQIAMGGRPTGLIDEAGSLAFSQPVRLFIFTTHKKRTRRSSSGTYRVYYTLLDVDKDGAVDTLRILSVIHAGARPVWDVEE